MGACYESTNRTTTLSTGHRLADAGVMRLMVTLDFNLAQVTLVVFAKGSQYVFKAVFRQRAPRAESRGACRQCHC